MSSFSRLIPTLSLVALLVSCGANKESNSNLEGDFRTQSIARPFVLFSTSPTWGNISEMIANKTPDRDASRLTNNELAWKIYSVSQCFEIDPYLFTSLIYQESAFNEVAESSTGAAGLTQFTTIGIKEVNDQLGFRGTDYARQSTTAYLNSAIKSCVIDFVGLNRWNNLWDQEDSLRTMRDRLKRDTNKALVYGAVHLKTQLAVVKTKNPGYSMKNTYKDALMRYNGDESEKDRYQRNIFRNAIRFTRIYE